MERLRQWGRREVSVRAGNGISIVELRRYSVHPGRREALIRLFEQELLEPQERAGMTVIGQFRDLDHPDRFIWLRGFPNLRVRAASLATFYEGPALPRPRSRGRSDGRRSPRR